MSAINVPPEMSDDIDIIAEKGAWCNLDKNRKNEYYIDKIYRYNG